MTIRLYHFGSRPLPSFNSTLRRFPELNRSLARTRTLSIMAESPAKKLKLDGPLIGTHNGHFHADEALAVYLLRLLPTYQSSPLVRTRDPEQLAKCHTVVDVGGEHSITGNRYDHHQRGFAEVFPNHNTKLSSAGLVYLQFGKKIIAQRIGQAEDSEQVGVLWEKLYDDLIEAFDANDNGIDLYDTNALKAAGIQSRFSNRGFSIASYVNRLNWHHADKAAETAKSKDQLQEEEDTRFERASQFTGENFVAELDDKWFSWYPARSKVREAYSHRHKWQAQGRVMVLAEGMPWSDHLYDAEKEAASAANGAASEHQVLYVLFPESTEPDSKWRIRAVSEENGGFKNRKDLPAAWQGVRDDELSKVSGIDGCIFVHASGFIGANKTFEGALEMAKKASDL